MTICHVQNWIANNESVKTKIYIIWGCMNVFISRLQSCEVTSNLIDNKRNHLKLQVFGSHGAWNNVWRNVWRDGTVGKYVTNFHTTILRLMWKNTAIEDFSRAQKQCAVNRRFYMGWICSSPACPENFPRG